MSTGKKRTIWTIGYMPFLLGGNVMPPIVTEVGYIEEKNIGKGFKAFSFQTPTGSIRIAESVTGAIIGSSFEEVMADVKNASKKFMKKQIEEAKKTVATYPKHLTPEQFFKMYRS